VGFLFIIKRTLNSIQEQWKVNWRKEQKRIWDVWWERNCNTCRGEKWSERQEKKLRNPEYHLCARFKYTRGMTRGSIWGIRLGSQFLLTRIHVLESNTLPKQRQWQNICFLTHTLTGWFIKFGNKFYFWSTFI